MRALRIMAMALVYVVAMPRVFGITFVSGWWWIFAIYFSYLAVQIDKKFFGETKCPSR
jgi:hypothetical protein